jgi:lipopolysaccharide/colanic/teichoic acid biosynthesis glycosyltransferase
VAIAVRLGSAGPVLYTQERVGKDGKSFDLYKFRSMRSGADRDGALVTGGGDPRVTRVGRLLRATKLDELPQLWNVLRGDMSLVGPRPEVPRYVAHYTPDQRRVLAVRPGITDPATLAFRDEEVLLAGVPPAEREAHYVREVMPAKLALNLEYLERCGFWSDLGVIARTVGAVVARRPSPRGSRRESP